MIRLVTAIIISPCVSVADIDAASKSTEIRACQNTVRVEERLVPKQLIYARYQDNPFRLMMVMAAKEKKTGAK